MKNIPKTESLYVDSTTNVPVGELVLPKASAVVNNTVHNKGFIASVSSKAHREYHITETYIGNGTKEKL